MEDYKFPLQITFLLDSNFEKHLVNTTAVCMAMGTSADSRGEYLLGPESLEVAMLRFDFPDEGRRDAALGRYMDCDFGRTHPTRVDLRVYDPMMRAEEIVIDLTQRFLPKVVR
jgi:hypothetical protein